MPEFELTYFSGHLSAKEKVVSRSLRIMLEDHLYWVLLNDRYVNCNGLHMRKHTRNSPADGTLAGYMFNRELRALVEQARSQAHAQGLSRYVPSRYCATVRPR